MIELCWQKGNKMKEEYIRPETEIIFFESEDVITASEDIDGEED